MTFGNLLKLTYIFIFTWKHRLFLISGSNYLYIIHWQRQHSKDKNDTCAPSHSSDLDQKGQITSDQGLTSAESPLYGCLKLTMSTARYFLTRARSACLAPSSSEWPLYSTEYKQNRMHQMITTEYKQNRMHQMITTNWVQTKQDAPDNNNRVQTKQDAPDDNNCYLLLSCYHLVHPILFVLS